jgi:hypothetical protein
MTRDYVDEALRAAGHADIADNPFEPDPSLGWEDYPAEYAKRKRARNREYPADIPLDETPPAESPADFGLPAGEAIDHNEQNTAPIPREKSLVAFPIVAFKGVHMDLERRNYLIKNLLPRSGLAVVWGPPKCYKSFWSMDVALHIARGRPYRGLRLQQAAVVYIMLEGREGLGARKEALARHYEIDDSEDVPLYFITSVLNLAKQARELAASIEAELGFITPGAIFVDTLNRSLVGSESKDEDMAAYLAGAALLEQKFRCLVAIVHHSGIDATRPRGHTSLTGAVEVQLRVERTGDLQALVTVEAAKDIPEGTQIASRLEVVELGRDIDGDPKTSLVVLPADASAVKPARKSEKSKRLTKSQRTIVDAIDEVLLDNSTEITPRAGMTAVRAAKVADVRKEFDRRYAAADPDKAPDAKRMAFGRALEWLPAEQYGTAAVNDTDWIWKLTT